MRPIFVILLFCLNGSVFADSLKSENTVSIDLENKNKYPFDTMTLGISTGYQSLTLKRPYSSLNGKQDTLNGHSPFLQLSAALHSSLIDFGPVDSFQIGLSMLTTSPMNGDRYSEKPFNDTNRQRHGSYSLNYNDYNASLSVYLNAKKMLPPFLNFINFIQFGAGYKKGETNFRETQSEFVSVGGQLNPISATSQIDDKFKTEGLFGNLGVEMSPPFMGNARFKVAYSFGKLSGQYITQPTNIPSPLSDTEASSIEASIIIPFKPSFNLGFSYSRYWYSLAAQKQTTSVNTIVQPFPAEQTQDVFKVSLYYNIH